MNRMHGDLIAKRRNDKMPAPPLVAGTLALTASAGGM
jgi:hypothetical protein